jgi:uncharacterized protein (TIGR02466 family)
VTSRRPAGERGSPGPRAPFEPRPDLNNLSSPEAVVEAGLAARDEGRFDDGISLLRQTLLRHPNNARLWHVLGLLHREVDDSASATAAFEKAAKLAPANAKIAHALAHVTLESGGAALERFNEALRLSPSDGDVWLGRAAAQLAEGRWDEAINDLAACLAGSPNWLAGQATLARLKWMRGESDFCRGYEDALASRPADPSLWHGWIDTLLHAELYEQADAIIAQARQSAGGNPLLDLAAAKSASEQGRLAEADHLFAQFQGSQDSHVAAERMRHLLRGNRPDEASAVGEAMMADPRSEVWPYLALAWRLAGDARWEWLEGDPRLIGVYDLGDDLLLALAPLLRSLHTSDRYPLGQSVRVGTQTDGRLLARSEQEIAQLRALLVDAVERYKADLPPKDDAHPFLQFRPDAVRFSGSWSVRLLAGGHHTHHVHPQGWLSSAYYVALPQQAAMGPIPAGWLALGRPPRELNLDLPPIRMLEPKPGRLILFPSTMWHGTEPFEAGERLSVAFDVAGR